MMSELANPAELSQHGLLTRLDVCTCNAAYCFLQPGQQSYCHKDESAGLKKGPESGPPLDLPRLLMRQPFSVFCLMVRIQRDAEFLD